MRFMIKTTKLMYINTLKTSNTLSMLAASILKLASRPLILYYYYKSINTDMSYILFAGLSNTFDAASLISRNLLRGLYKASDSSW